MKILKYLILLLFLLVAGAAAYIALLNKDVSIDNNINIKAPQELVFKKVSNLSSWEKWIAADYNAAPVSFTYLDEDTQGSLVWKTKNNDLTGYLTNKDVVHYSNIEQEASSKKRYGKTDYQLAWQFTRENDSTAINLHVTGEPNFMAKAIALIKKEDPEASLKADIQSNLRNLKVNILKDMQAYTINIDGEKELSSISYIYTTQASQNEPALILEKQQQIFPALQKQVDENYLTTTDDPMMIYNAIDKQHNTVILSFAIPVEEEQISPQSGILTGSLNVNRYIKATLKGNYTHIPKLWEGVRVYMQQHQLIQNEDAPAFERYKITQKDTANPADWVTELYVPFQENQLLNP